MKRVKNTPIQDEINKNVIKGMFVIMDGLMPAIRIAEKEPIKEYNNNYYLYKMNYDYIEQGLKALDGEYIFGLLSDEEKAKLKNILDELNSLSKSFNENIKTFNTQQKNKNIFARVKLKPFSDILLKNLGKEK